MSKETLFVSFSGGRTSAYMCWYLIEFWSWKYNFIFIFANTGQEHENTIKFVDQCDKAFGLNLIWLEAVVNPEKGKGIRHRIVSFDNHSSNGEPFEDYIAKYGIPNSALPQCTWRLKVEVMQSYKRSIGFKTHHQTAIGIRSDEIDRMNIKGIDDGSIIYPLIKFTHKTKPEIIHWWKDQDFDLNLPEHMGNCVTCWKKSDRKLMTIAKHEPERFNFFSRMENKYSDFKCDKERGRVFFRGERRVSDIIASSKLSFVEFVDHTPELQFKMDFDIDPLDLESSCGESCEAH